MATVSTEARQRKLDWLSERYAAGKDLLGACPVNTLKRSRKKFLLRLLGGGCQICGYQRCDASLAFHHVDPSEKETSLSSTKLQKALSTVLREMAKCVLVCNNCHGEIHAGQLPAEDLAPHRATVASAIAPFHGKAWSDIGLDFDSVVADAVAA